MDIKTFLQNLHEQANRSVHTSKFAYPKQVPGLRDYILEGQQRIEGRKSGILTESASRIEISSDALSEDTRIGSPSSLSAMAIEESHKNGVKCGNCDKISTKASCCFQCCCFWCDVCLVLHNGIKAHHRHKALTLKDLRDEDLENILNYSTFCGKPGHEKKEFEFFCQVCEISICSACALLDHEGHTKTLLEKAANERKLKVNAAVEAMKKIVQDQRAKLAQLDDNCKKVQEHADEVKSGVRRFVAGMNASIETEKDALFDDLEKKIKEVLERMGERRQDIEHEVKTHETEIEKGQLLLNRSTNVQIMQHNKFLDEMLGREYNKEGKDSADLDEGRLLTKFYFVGNQQLLKQLETEKIGRLISDDKSSPRITGVEGKGITKGIVGLEAEIIVTTRNIRGEQCYRESDWVTVEIKNQQGLDCATIAHVHDNKDGTYKISYFAKETGASQVSVKVNGKHVSGSPFEVELKPRHFKLVVSAGREGSSSGMLYKPWGVAVNDKNDEIVVTEVGNHRVSVFNGNGVYSRSFGRKGDQKGEFDCPAGIALHGDKIIVADGCNHRVQVISDQGKYLGQFGGEGSLDHQFQNPHGLSVNKEGNIVVADRRNKSIKIFSHDGQCLQTIGADHSLISPYHCMQHDRHLIVSDRSNHCIVVFDEEGKVLRKFGQKGDADGEFNAPGGLSVDRAGHLLVCDTGNHRVQVFELSGKFVTKFGRQGAKPGEFNLPISTAILADGRIVVTDFQNHRVQIFS